MNRSLALAGALALAVGCYSESEQSPAAPATGSPAVDASAPAADTAGMAEVRYYQIGAG